MIEENYPSWVTQDRNRRNNLAVTDAFASAGMRYVVLFALSPSKAGDVNVELVVKSAFEKDISSLTGKKRTGVRQMIKKCHFQDIELP